MTALLLTGPGDRQHSGQHVLFDRASVAFERIELLVFGDPLRIPNVRFARTLFAQGAVGLLPSRVHSLRVELAGLTFDRAGRMTLI